MPDFTSYEIGPDGLVRLKRADGTENLPGATVAERRASTRSPPQPMTPETVPDGIVSAQGRRRRCGLRKNRLLGPRRPVEDKPELAPTGG